MSEWIDLQQTDQLAGYAVHMMAILNNTGAGRACYLQLFNADKETIHSFLLTPELAGRLGWSLTGVMNGFEPAAMAFEDDDDEDDDEDDEDDDE